MQHAPAVGVIDDVAHVEEAAQQLPQLHDPLARRQALAVALVEGDVGLYSFDDAHLANADLIALTNAHVSEAVIRSVQNDSSNRDANARYPRSTVLVSPYAYPYPYYYSPYYDPFFYPRLSIGFGFGFGRRFGGGFRHR